MNDGSRWPIGRWSASRARSPRTRSLWTETTGGCRAPGSRRDPSGGADDDRQSFRCLRRGHVRLERLQGRVDQGGGPVGALGEHVRQVEDAQRIERPEDQRNEDGRAQERCQALAPSTLAASFSSSGIIASLDLHQRLAAAVEGRNSSVEREINEILVRPADQVADAQHGKSGAPPLPEWGRVGRSGAGGLRTVGLATYSRGPTRTEERT
jgi:hypothetical protein